MKPEDLVIQIRNLHFSERETIDEAFDYLCEVARHVNNADAAAMVAATGVLLNTIANEIDKLEA